VKAAGVRRYQKKIWRGSSLVLSPFCRGVSHGVQPGPGSDVALVITRHSSHHILSLGL